MGCKQQALLDEGILVSRDTCGFTLSYRTPSVSSQWQWQMQSVVQSKSTRSPSSVVTEWMGDRYVLGFVPALRFLRSQILCRLHKSPMDETINQGPPMCICMQKDHISMLKILQSMSKFGGLWKQQNNPACTKNDSNGQRCGRWSLMEEDEVEEYPAISTMRL